MTTIHNADPAELERFAKIAATWWDPNAESRVLHDLNPTRMDYIRARCTLKNLMVLDVGCGGGLLSEALANAGAEVTAIDLAPELLAVAKLHLHESGLTVDYQEISIEQMAQTTTAAFDVITCMEMLEHVPDPASIITACAKLLKPGGHLFLSTINRTPQAFAYTIVGAEYIAQLLPKGTHHYDQFIQPSELAQWLRTAQLQLQDVSGLCYNPLLKRASITRNPSINYLMHARKPEDC